MTRVLIVEDEPDIALGLQEDLTRHGYEVTVVADGDSAVAHGREQGWDVILLDVMLPRRDGFEVCRELRRLQVKAPIILLTARTQEAEKILGLELGADDYVTKPFSAAELRARIKAVVRRARGDSAGVFAFGDCEVDFDRAEVRRAGKTVDATTQEFRILRALVERRGRVLSREQLIEQAWGAGMHIGDRVVDTHILNLRKKIEPDSREPRYVVSVRGMGYRFDG